MTVGGVSCKALRESRHSLAVSSLPGGVTRFSCRYCHDGWRPNSLCLSPAGQMFAANLERLEEER